MNCLSESFFQPDPTEVARALLGMRLVRQLNGRRISGIISETEAYRGEDDLACHAHRGKTRRNSVMYANGGRAYIYFTYGMHWCLNAVCGAEGYPAAVLIRALQPEEGLDLISAHRPAVKPALWCNGPAKLCKAFAIDGELNASLLTDPANPLFIEEGLQVDDKSICASARIGIDNTPEPWRSIPWRYTFTSEAGA